MKIESEYCRVTIEELNPNSNPPMMITRSISETTSDCDGEPYLALYFIACARHYDKPIFFIKRIIHYHRDNYDFVIGKSVLDEFCLDLAFTRMNPATHQ